MNTTFKSAVDWWYYLLIVILAGVLGYRLLAALESGTLQLQLSLLVLFLIAVGFPIVLLVTTRYSIESGILTVRAGPFTWKINLSEIRSVEPIRSPASSPALSLKRLKIEYGDRKTILVSPRDQDAFLEAIGAGRVT